MTIYIKNMVCGRCVMVVRQEFEKWNLKVMAIRLGEVDLESQPPQDVLLPLQERLQALGFEILDDHKKSQIEKMKTALIEYVQKGDLPTHFSLSDFLTKLLLRDYGKLSRLFS